MLRRKPSTKKCCNVYAGEQVSIYLCLLMSVSVSVSVCESVHMCTCIEARGQTLGVDLYFSILFWKGSLCLCRPCFLAHKLLAINPFSTFHLCCRKCTSVADSRFCAWFLSGFCVPKLTYSGLHDIYFHSLSHLPLRYRGSFEFSSLQNRKRPPWFCLS